MFGATDIQACPACRATGTVKAHWWSRRRLDCGECEGTGVLELTIGADPAYLTILRAVYEVANETAEAIAERA